jgi:hypothetical protein
LEYPSDYFQEAAAAHQVPPIIFVSRFRSEGKTTMHLFGAFELDVRPGTPDNPASIRVALLRYTRGEDGRLFITPECATFEEVEGQLNSLQDELDEIRERARRAFQIA